MSATDRTTHDLPDLTGCRVLLVEDEYFIADDLRRALEGCGADGVGPAPTLGKAISLASGEDLTCAVLDLNLRGESAIEVAEILHRRHVPFICSTGYRASDMPDHIKGAPHFEKPFRMETLLRELGRICEGYAG